MEKQRKLDLLIEYGLKCITFKKKMFQMFIEKELNDEDFTEELQDEYANKCSETTNIVLEIIKLSDCYDVEITKSLINEHGKNKDLRNCIMLENYIDDIKIILAICSKVPNSQIAYNKAKSVDGEYDVILHKLLVEYLKEHKEISSHSKKEILDTFSYILLNSSSLTEKYKGNKARYFDFSHPELFNNEKELLLKVKKSCESNVEIILNELESPRIELTLYLDKYLEQNKDLLFIFPIVASFIQSEKHEVKLELKEHNLGECAISLLKKAKEIYEQYSYVGKEIEKEKKVILLKETKKL